MESIDAVIDEIRGNDPELIVALSEATLPVDDLAVPGRSFFRFSESRRLIGFVGCEIVGNDGALLRSLVVVPSERGKGRGHEMADWMLRRLSGLGIKDAWMLTTTAEKFGADLGFVRIEREMAPDAVRRTQQFATLCSSSSMLMHRRLG